MLQFKFEIGLVQTALLRQGRIRHFLFMIYWTFEILWWGWRRLDLLVKFGQVFVLLDAAENLEWLHLDLVDALGGELRAAGEHAQSSALRRWFDFRWRSFLLLMVELFGRHCLIKEGVLCFFRARLCIQLWPFGFDVVPLGLCSAVYEDLRW